VRLVDGNSSWSGRLELRSSPRGPWGAVCPGGLGYADADIVCRQLGLGQRGRLMLGAASVGNEPFAQGRGALWAVQSTCNGSEPSLESCATLELVPQAAGSGSGSSSGGGSGCTQARAVGVRCQVNVVSGGETAALPWCLGA